MSTKPDDGSGAPRAGAITIGERATAVLADPLIRSAYSLAASSVLTSSLGMAFWILAARIYPSDDVGSASALIAAMVTLSALAQLNMSMALLRFMPGRPQAARFLIGAYLASGLAAVLVGTAFVFIAPQTSDDFAFLTSDPLAGIGFVVAVVLWGIFALQDAALTAMRRAPWVLVENGVFGVLKLVALPLLFLVGSSKGPFIAWVLPMCMLLVPVNWLLFRRILVGERPALEAGVEPFGRRRLVRFLALDYSATVFIQTSLTVLPLLVVAILGSRANAHFYIPFTIAMALDGMFWSMSASLVAEGALSPGRTSALVRLLVRRVALFVVPLVAVLIIAAPLVMAPFGAEYVRESTTVLRLVLAASLFRAMILLAAAIWRLEGRAGRIAVLDGCTLVGLLCAAIPLAHAFGVNGVAVAWLGSAMAIGCAVLPVLVRHVRAPDETQSPRAPLAGA